MKGIKMYFSLNGGRESGFHNNYGKQMFHGFFKITNFSL